MISPHSVFNIPRSLNSVFRESFNIVSLAGGYSSRDNFPQKFIPSLEKVKKQILSGSVLPVTTFCMNLCKTWKGQLSNVKVKVESEMNIILRLWPAGDNFPSKFMQNLERATLK